MKDIHDLKLKFAWMGVVWTARSANSIADMVAKLTGCHQLPNDWISNPPPMLASLVRSEMVEG